MALIPMCQHDDPTSSHDYKQDVLQAGHGSSISGLAHHKANPLGMKQIIVIVASTFRCNVIQYDMIRAYEIQENND